MYQFIGRKKEAWTNISKSFSRITSSLQRTGIEKPTLHNFTWILVHKHMFGMRLRGHGVIQTDMKTIQKHVIKRFSNISGRSCFNRLRRFAVIIWIFSTTWSPWYYGHGFLFLLLQSSTVLTHLFSRGIILTYSILRGRDFKYCWGLFPLHNISLPKSLWKQEGIFIRNWHQGKCRFEGEIAHQKWLSNPLSSGFEWIVQTTLQLR